MRKTEYEIKKCQDCLCHLLVNDQEEFCLQYEEEIPSSNIALKDRTSKPDFCKLSKIIMEFTE